MNGPLSPCPVCQTPLGATPRHPDNDLDWFDCPRCGRFALTIEAHQDLNSYLRNDRQRYALSHAIRRSQSTRPFPVFRSAQVQRIAKDAYLPTPREQADLLIHWLGDNLPGPGQTIDVNPRDHGAAIGATSVAGFMFVVRGIMEDGLADGRSKNWEPVPGTVHLAGAADVTLTFKGWDRFEQLRHGIATGLTAFMAMKFGDATLDRMVDQHLRPAVAATGFHLRRLDDEPRAGLIDDRLRVEIKACRFLIADLTHGNKGAYWEAGFAEGLGKPVIYTCKREVFESHDHPDRPHFDTNHHLTVVWDDAAPEAAMELLKATIRATLPDARQMDGA